MATTTTEKKVSRGPSAPIRYYLIFFNLLSFFGWVLILTSTIKHLAFGPQSPSLPLLYCQKLISPFRSLKILQINPANHLPPYLANLHLNAQTLQQFVSPLVAIVQSFAILEIVHAALGWVRSPVPTTTIQVSSRLFLVWGVTERYPEAMTNPWYVGMIIAWSVTECIRYPFYASQLMGGDTSGLLWARYTTFFVLYPLGAVSEAMEIFSTLPNKFLWQDLSAWNLRQGIFALLFVIWWPGLYVMYSHMMSQRRRAIGKGFWGDKAIENVIEKKKLEANKKK